MGEPAMTPNTAPGNESNHEPFPGAEVLERALAALDGLPAAERKAAMAQLIAQLGLRGHDQEIDEEIVPRQAKALADSGSILEAIRLELLGAVERMTKEWSAFRAGRIAIPFALPHQGYTGTVGWNELQDALIAEFPDLDLAQFPAPKSTTAEIMEMQDSGWIFQIAQAMGRILAARGLFKGPCRECGREPWPVAYRAPGRPGRAPLEWTYCPACATAYRKRVNAAHQRAHVRRTRGENPRGRPKKT